MKTDEEKLISRRESQKRYRERNKDKIKESRQARQPKINAYYRDYYKVNGKDNYIKNKEKLNMACSKWYAKNSEVQKEKMKEYYKLRLNA